MPRWPEKLNVVESLRELRDDRAGFVERFFLAHQDDDIEVWQARALKALDGGATRVAVRSGHGVGKTTLLAWCILHFMFTRYPQKTIVTAPTKGQLYDALAAETKHWLNVMPKELSGLFEPFMERIELKAAPESSFCGFRTSRDDKPETLQGIHSDHVMMIVDEASGVPDPVYIAAGGSMSSEGSIMILAGNPTRASGYFNDIFKADDPGWVKMTVSCFDSSRVDASYPKQIARQFGDDSNVYRVRVLGLPPLFDADKLVALDVIEAAVNRDIVVADGPGVWGLDVARSGNDRCVLIERKARAVTWAKEWRGQDLMQSVGTVKAKWDEMRESERPSSICVDAIGLGAGVADRLNELGLPARPVNVAEISAMNEQALRLRDDLWLQLRDWLVTRAVTIPDLPPLIRDISAPTFELTSNGKYQVASKAKMKRDGFQSPDYADALCLTFADMPFSAVYGSEGSSAWGGWNGELQVAQPTIM